MTGRKEGRRRDQDEEVKVKRERSQTAHVLAHVFAHCIFSIINHFPMFSFFG
jgi:hypothetical protein